MDTFKEREDELLENLGVQKAANENLKEKLKKMRTYARKARNMALDYFPPNEELPEILTKDLSVFLEDAENESVIQFLEFEVRSLREKTKKLQFELDRLKGADIRPAPGSFYATLVNPENATATGKVSVATMRPGARGTVSNLGNSGNIDNLSEKEIQKRILEEIQKLGRDNNGRMVKESSGGVSGVGGKSAAVMNAGMVKEMERLKSENSLLSAENKRLKSTINETALSDIKIADDPENQRALKMKISFLQKTIESLEKERSELNMRCTMAEEQLKNFQEMFNTTTQGYQKKILELNKRLEAANLRINQEYMNANYGDEED